MSLIGIRNPRNYGQLGEDAVIENHLSWLGLDLNKKGAYLDIGCNHPWKGSNTFKFYEMVQCGYVIDVGQAKLLDWKRLRPKDYFINTAIVPNNYPKEFVSFNLGSQYGEPTGHIVDFGILPHSKNDYTIKVKTTKAKEINQLVCADPLWVNAHWRLLNVDIEGLDYEVISCLDLEELKPDVIAIESFAPEDVSYADKINYHANENTLVKHLNTCGYSLQSICGPTLILIRIKSKR